MWTEKDERQWKEMTDRREKNKKDVGKQHTIDVLKKMIVALELGLEDPIEINVEYIREESPYAYPGLAPVCGKKITLTYR